MNLLLVHVGLIFYYNYIYSESQSNNFLIFNLNSFTRKNKLKYKLRIVMYGFAQLEIINK